MRTRRSATHDSSPSSQSRNSPVNPASSKGISLAEFEPQTESRRVSVSRQNSFEKQSPSIVPCEQEPTSPAKPKERSGQSLTLPEGWKIRNLDDALKGSPKPPWIIDDLVLAETATQVSAHPHGMKSLAWLDATIEAPAKHTVWQHFTARSVRSTLFIESEDSTWVIEDRIWGFAAGLGLKGKEDVQGFHYLRTGPFDLVDFENKLGDILRYYQVDFAVLSTLQSLLKGRDWNEQSQMQDVNAAIVRLAAICPLVVITHSPWDKKAKRAAGSITQAANFLTTMHFEKVSTKGDGSNFVHVSVDSKLGAEQTDFSLRLVTDGEGKQKQVRGILYEGTGWPKGGGKAAVLAAIQEDPDATPREIAEHIGVTPRYVQRLMKEMSQERKGKVKK